MLDSETATAIQNAVDAGFEEQLGLTAQLVRYPSVRGSEHPAQENSWLPRCGDAALPLTVGKSI